HSVLRPSPRWRTSTGSRTSAPRSPDRRVRWRPSSARLLSRRARKRLLLPTLPPPPTPGAPACPASGAHPLPSRPPASRERALAVSAALRCAHPGAGAFAKALRRGSADLAGWARAVLAGSPDEVAAQAQAARLDPDLAASVLRVALLPLLAPWSAALDAQR